MKIFTNISILLLLTACFLRVGAQKPMLTFNSYSAKNGLPSGTVTSLLKDSFGFLWVATEDGLFRFTGSEFKAYRHDPANPRSLKVNHITSLYETLDGDIWIGTNGGGLSFYNRNKDSVFNYTSRGNLRIGDAVTSVGGDNEGNVWVTCFGSTFIIDTKSGDLIVNSKYNKLLQAVAGKVSLTFFQDSKKNLWIGTDQGLFCFNPGNNMLKLFRHSPENIHSISAATVTKITEDKLGNIWLATGEGLYMQKPNTESFIVLNHSSTPQLSSNLITSLAIDKNNKLWIGTDQGLDILDIAANTVLSCVPDIRDPHSLTSRSIRDILIDKQGICWIGTYRGGLNKYDENFNYFSLKECNVFDPYGLRAPIVTSFAAYQKDIFVGTDGGGLQLYRRNSGLLDPITLSRENSLTIMALTITKDNLLWAGTFANGLYCYNPANNAVKHYSKGPGIQDLSSNDIFCLKEDKAGNLWIGTNGGGLNVIQPGSNRVEKYVRNSGARRDSSAPASNFIQAIEEDNRGQIWAGTFGSGISVFDTGSKKFVFYSKHNSGLPSNYIRSIKCDSKGNIWVGSSGNGIGLLKKGHKQFDLLTEKDGLANDLVNIITEDLAGKIWLGTNNGLSCYNTSSGVFKNYSSHNGLQSGAFMPGASLVLSDGEIFLGGQYGFNHFNPADLKTNKHIPQIALTDLKVDNQLVTPSSNGPISRSLSMAEDIHLKYKQGFSIGFEALDFTMAEANQYQYKLDGYDKNWVQAGKEHSAYYANIPPGNYVFHVRASNNDGVWNQQGRSILVYIAPPLWRTNAAYILYLILIAGTLLYLRQRAINKIQARFKLEQERQQAKELIERERKEAEYLHKLDKLKIKFLTNLSHEFKTPISLIMGPVENLTTHVSGEGPQNQLNLIKRNSKRLLNLVNQLLDFRKIEERELKLQCSEGDIVLFIKDLSDSFNEIARKKNIKFEFYPSFSRLDVLFDHDKIERILFNLLSNAFKFTPEKGNVAVSVKESQMPATPGFISIAVSVKDSGIGIPKKDQVRIFDPFFQHEINAEILNQGTGIGLAITREFVQLHGGALSVESEPGEGSNFTFQLALKLSGAAVQQPNTEDTNLAAELPPQLSLSNGKKNTHSSLLIVEDDDDFRFYIKENLKDSYNILEASNGAEGWQRALFHHPDLIVCDVQMPMMNGFDLVQKIKSDKRTKHIPAILLTAADNPTSMLNGLETGAIDYITKPFDFNILEAKITNILLLNQSYRETYSKQVTVVLPETEAVSEKDNFLQRVLSYVYENVDNSQLSVETLSSHLCISRASLYNKLLEYTGKTPVDFIKNVKLEKARDLLEKTNKTVTEVAYETGFSNANYFTKVFKAKYNQKPSEFQAEKRKQHRTTG